MKALTLHQPWAWLVADGQKRIETRSWGTAYRGPLAIHAGKRPPDVDGFDLAFELNLSVDFLEAQAGRVLAVGILVDVVQVPEAFGPGGYPLGMKLSELGSAGSAFDRAQSWEITWFETRFGDLSAGRFLWLLADVRRLADPPLVRGRQGLWEWHSPHYPLDEFGVLRDGTVAR